MSFIRHLKKCRSLLLASLENIQIDVQDLTRGLDNAKKELSIRQTLKVCGRLDSNH